MIPAPRSTTPLWRNDIGMEIAGVTVRTGGDHGRPVMVGSIFHRGDRLVTDHDRGVFDQRGARERLQREAEVAAATGLPRIPDIVGQRAEALYRYVNFVAEQVSGPLMLDAPLASVRLAALRLFERHRPDLLPRIIYNSVDENSTPEELKALAELGVRTAVILALGSEAVRPRDRARLVAGPGGLVHRVRAAGIENILVDTGVLDIASIGWSVITFDLVREATGLPVGCAPANAMYLWARQEQPGPRTFAAVAAATLAYPAVLGADFLFYGPLSNAPWAYRAVRAAGEMVTYARREQNGERGVGGGVVW